MRFYIFQFEKIIGPGDRIAVCLLLGAGRFQISLTVFEKNYGFLLSSFGTSLSSFGKSARYSP